MITVYVQSCFWICCIFTLSPAPYSEVLFMLHCFKLEVPWESCGEIGLIPHVQGKGGETEVQVHKAQACLRSSLHPAVRIDKQLPSKTPVRGVVAWQSGACREGCCCKDRGGKSGGTRPRILHASCPMYHQLSYLAAFTGGWVKSRPQSKTGLVSSR